MAEPTSNATRNVLSSDIQITGTVKFGSDLLLDGKIDGEILSDGSLVIGKRAEVLGEIKTGSASIHGAVVGNITVKDRVELKSTAHVEGDIKAARVSIDDGAAFIGNAEITSSGTRK